MQLLAIGDPEFEDESIKGLSKTFEGVVELAKQYLSKHGHPAFVYIYVINTEEIFEVMQLYGTVKRTEKGAEFEKI